MKAAILLLCLMPVGLLHGQDTDMAIMVLKHVNEARADERVQPVTLNYDLNEPACSQATFVQSLGKLTHQQKGNALQRTLGDRLSYFHITGYRMAGEIISRTGYSHPPEKATIAFDLFETLYFSPSHRDIMLDKGFNEVGVCVYSDTDTNGLKYWYVVLVFKG